MGAEARLKELGIRTAPRRRSRSEITSGGAKRKLVVHVGHRPAPREAVPITGSSAPA